MWCSERDRIHHALQICRAICAAFNAAGIASLDNAQFAAGVAGVDADATLRDAASGESRSQLQPCSDGAQTLLLGLRVKCCRIELQKRSKLVKSCLEQPRDRVGHGASRRCGWRDMISCHRESGPEPCFNGRPRGRLATQQKPTPTAALCHLACFWGRGAQRQQHTILRRDPSAALTRLRSHANSSCATLTNPLRPSLCTLFSLISLHATMRTPSRLLAGHEATRHDLSTRRARTVRRCRRTWHTGSAPPPSARAPLGAGALAWARD